MAWTTKDIPDLSGKVAVVTGANSGLGLESSRALAAAGAHVVMGARDPGRAAAAEADIRRNQPDASLEVVQLDLASLTSIEEAARGIASAHQKVDILMNNAGLMATPESRTEDGFEMQFGVNHLGHYALTARLVPALLSAEAGRVVTVTSTAHHLGRAIDPANPHLEGRYNPWRAYNISKLANFHFAIGLHRRFQSAGVKAASYVAHPGLSNTELQARSVTETDGGASQKFWHFLARNFGMTPARGALPQLRAATDPEAKSGGFYAPRYMAAGRAVRVPIVRRIGLSRAIDRLWEVSERSTGLTIDLSTSGRPA